jgi:hypothetical protein
LSDGANSILHSTKKATGAMIKGFILLYGYCMQSNESSIILHFRIVMDNKKDFVLWIFVRLSIVRLNLSFLFDEKG